jgi:hypothetical protein
LARELHQRLTDATSEIAERLEMVGHSLWIDKRVLSGVHGCERRFQADEAVGFPGWSPALARGAVSHRAIQIAAFSPKPLPPLEAVDTAINRMIEDGDRGLAEFLRVTGDAELADLRASASDVVTKFEECFPPLVASWRPRIESPSRHELHKGTITLGARPDLALGRPDGNQARVLVVDLKTGGRYQGHAEDLRFYALVETLRLGVPPFRVATFYLDAARWESEDVTEDLLEIAVRRTIDGARKLGELLLGERSAEIKPGPGCAHCGARDDCEGPEQWAAMNP